MDRVTQEERVLFSDAIEATANREVQCNMTNGTAQRRYGHRSEVRTLLRQKL